MAISPKKSQESCLMAVESYIDSELKVNGGRGAKVVVDRFFEGNTGRRLLEKVIKKYDAAGWEVEYDAPSQVPFDYGTLIFFPKESDID